VKGVIHFEHESLLLAVPKRKEGDQGGAEPAE